MRLRNISRYGDLDVPLIGAEVAAGDVVDVTPEQARRLLVMLAAFEPADEEAAAVAAELAALDDDTTFGDGPAVDVGRDEPPATDPVPDQVPAKKPTRSRATTTEVTA